MNAEAHVGETLSHHSQARALGGDHGPEVQASGQSVARSMQNASRSLLVGILNSSFFNLSTLYNGLDT